MTTLTLPALWTKARAKVRRRCTPAGLILLYHRIAHQTPDPWRLCVTPEFFAEQIDVLTRMSTITPLRDLQSRLQTQNLAQRSVAVTFDDGYCDNLEIVRAILERKSVPATFFITGTGQLQPEPFWWDELSRIVLNPGPVPSEIQLSCAEQTFEWSFPNNSPPTTNLDSPHWNAITDPPQSPRHQLFLALYRLLQPRGKRERESLLAQLQSQWAAPQPLRVPINSSLTGSEIIRLSSDLVEIGGHTATHPLLTALPLLGQESEITANKAALQSITGRSIQSFSYPHGAFSNETAALVKKLGFKRACTTATGLVRSSSDSFHLHRHVVENWDGEQFRRRLSEWLYQ